MLGHDPTFSVVIPLHDKEPHVVRALSSVLRQTYANFEVIVIDDASTDGSAERIKEFKDKRIRLLHRTVPGPGGYAARNLGIRTARAQWVAFLDADDEWLPDHLFRLHGMQHEFPTVRFFGAGWHTADGTERAVNPYYMKHGHSGSHTLDFWSFVRADLTCGQPVYTSTVCVRKETIVAAGGFPEQARKGGDTDTWFRIMHGVGVCGWSAHIGAVYYRDTINPASRRPTGETPAIAKSIRAAIAATNMTRRQRYLLMRSSNHNSHSTISLALRAGILSRYQLTHYYFTANPIKWTSLHAFLLAQAIAPGITRALLIHRDRMLRRGFFRRGSVASGVPVTRAS